MTMPPDDIPLAPDLDDQTERVRSGRTSRVLGAAAVLAVAFSFGRVGTVDADVTTALQDDLERAQAVEAEQADDIAAMESDLASAAEDRDRAVSDQDDLRAEATSMASELEQAQTDLSGERSRADDAEGRIADVERTALRDARAEATKELEAQQATLDTRAEKLDERESELDTRKAELDARSSQLDDRADDLAEAEAAAAEIEVPRLGASSSSSDDSGSSSSSSGDCHPAYDPCVPPGPPDLNCPDVGFQVTVDHSIGDPHGLDGSDNDGLGCESY